MHQDQTEKLKSTSEVTLQDSNLEEYWQRGKKPGLVHGRDTVTDSPPSAAMPEVSRRGRGLRVPPASLSTCGFL